MADQGLVTVRRQKDVDGLYYITRVANLPSILEQGVLSHRQVLDRQLDFTPVYNEAIVSNPGCGLSGLAWAEVGPVMCRFADQMPIPICIYLPNEEDIPSDQLELAFLLEH